MQSSRRFFKITNQTECHHGFQYKEGLNIDTLPFTETGKCVPGGLYFTDEEHILEHVGYGVWIREIMLPTDDNDFQMVRDGHKWRANKIILGPRFALNHPQSLIRLRISLAGVSDTTSITIVDRASKLGHIAILQLWRQSRPDLEYTNYAMDEASRQGYISVLSWWYESGLQLKYTEMALHWATIKSQVATLQWWKDSKLPFKVSENSYRTTLESCKQLGIYSTLRWWKEAAPDHIVITP